MGERQDAAPDRRGFLDRLPPRARARLLAGAIRIDLPAGAVVYRQDEPPRTIVVESGVLRAFLRSPDGREATVRFARAGDTIGLAMATGGPAPISVEVALPATIVVLLVDVLRNLIDTDPAVARAVAEELGRQLFAAYEEAAESQLLTVRERVIDRLLDLAEDEGDGRLVVRMTQQELADGVSAAREVVSRALAGLRRARLIETGRDRITILDPAGLARELASGGSVPGPDDGAPGSPDERRPR